MKVKEESEKVGLKLNIQKTKIMASSPITSWQIDGETMETMKDFILGGSKIAADGDSSHKIKRHLLLERKAMTNLDSILLLLKSRDITLPILWCRSNFFLHRNKLPKSKYLSFYFLKLWKNKKTPTAILMQNMSIDFYNPIQIFYNGVTYTHVNNNNKGKSEKKKRQITLIEFFQ